MLGSLLQRRFLRKCTVQKVVSYVYSGLLVTSTLAANPTRIALLLLLARSLVWKPRARFVDAAFLQKHYPDAELDGIYPADDTLKGFLVSPPCVYAAIRLQHAFEVTSSREACREQIENYANLGGDQGLTEDAMRQACGLPPRNRTQDLHAVPAGMTSIGSQDEQGQRNHELEPVADMIMELCLSEGRDVYTLGNFSYKKLPAGTPNMEREALWNQLETDGVMRTGAAKGRAKSGLMPVIRTKRRLADVFTTVCDEEQTTFTEVYDVHRFRQAICGNASRESNVCIIIQFLDALIARKPRVKGKPSAQEVARWENLQTLANKLSAHEKTLGEIMSMLDDFEQSQHDPGVSQKQKRRLRAKLSEPVEESQNEQRVRQVGASASSDPRKRPRVSGSATWQTVNVRYKCSAIEGVRSRRYVQGPRTLSALHARTSRGSDARRPPRVRCCGLVPMTPTAAQCACRCNNRHCAQPGTRCGATRTRDIVTSGSPPRRMRSAVASPEIPRSPHSGYMGFGHRKRHVRLGGPTS